MNDVIKVNCVKIWGKSILISEYILKGSKDVKVVGVNRVKEIIVEVIFMRYVSIFKVMISSLDLF